MYFTYIINFNIGFSTVFQEYSNNATLSNLIIINYLIGSIIDFDLHYHMFLIVKKIYEKIY